MGEKLKQCIDYKDTCETPTILKKHLISYFFPIFLEVLRTRYFNFTQAGLYCVQEEHLINVAIFLCSTEFDITFDTKKIKTRQSLASLLFNSLFQAPKSAPIASFVSGFTIIVGYATGSVLNEGVTKKIVLPGY